MHYTVCVCIQHIYIYIQYTYMYMLYIHVHLVMQRYIDVYTYTNICSTKKCMYYMWIKEISMYIHNIPPLFMTLRVSLWPKLQKHPQARQLDYFLSQIWIKPLVFDGCSCEFGKLHAWLGGIFFKGGATYPSTHPLSPGTILAPAMDEWRVFFCNSWTDICKTYLL